MPELHWQKSTYSQEASACVHVASDRAGTIYVLESDAPARALATGPAQLAALIAILTGTEKSTAGLDT